MGKTVVKKKILQHTRTERIQMRRHKRKNGPSGQRRAERRKKLQRRVASVAENVMPVEMACAQGTTEKVDE